MTKENTRERLLSRRKLLALIGIGTAGGLGGMYTMNDKNPENDGKTLDSDKWMEPKVPEGPPGTENILNYGGMVGIDTPEAAKANVEAIHAASVASDTNTVYIPAGRWYVGDKEAARFLHPGAEDEERGAAGLGFIGDGPEETYLIFQKDTLSQGGGNEIDYAPGVDHGSVVWQDLTYDGNYQNMDFDKDTRQWGIYSREDSSVDFKFQNFRLRNIHGVGISSRGSASLSIDIDRCTFQDIGIGRVNQSGGTSLSHIFGPTIPDGKTMTVTNSLFELTSGSVIDFSYSDTFGKVSIHNCYATSIGDTFIKEKGMKEVRVSNVYFRANTPELERAMNEEARSLDRHGRGFLKQLSGAGNGTIYILDNVEVTSTLRRAINIRAGKHWTVRGGRDGPIRFRNINMDGNEDSTVWQDYAPNSYFKFDVGTMIAENVAGVVFECENSEGTIETLYENNTKGIGGTGQVLIGSVFPRTDTEPHAPKVPARAAVGINTYPEDDTEGRVDNE